MTFETFRNLRLRVVFLFFVLGLSLESTTAIGGPCDSERVAYNAAASALADAQTTRAIAYAAWQQAMISRY